MTINIDEYKAKKIKKNLDEINEKYDNLDIEAILEHLSGKKENIEALRYFVDNFERNDKPDELRIEIKFTEEQIAEMKEFYNPEDFEPRFKRIK